MSSSPSPGSGSTPSQVASSPYQTCVHLGCRVPWCSSSQGFECPCHSSKYSAAGEYSSGPATRNLDRFRVSVDAENRFVIATGSLVSTARSQRRSAPYPLGPHCA